MPNHEVSKTTTLKKSVV